MIYPLILNFLPMIFLYFSVIHNSVITTLELNSGLARIKQRKMSFSPDPNKQALEAG